MAEIILEHSPVSPSNPAKVSLCAKQDGNILHLDTVDLTREDRREVFVKGLIQKHEGLESQKEAIEKEMMSLADKLLAEPKKRTGDVSRKPCDISKQELEKTDVNIVDAAKEFLARPDLLDCILQHIETIGLVGERGLATQLYLVGVSRLLPRPLATIVLGSSSSGKSFSANTVGSLFPQETVLKAHRISPQALVYMEPGSLEHRFIVMGERSRDISDEVVEQTRTWRELVSDGECRLAVTATEGGKTTTDYRVQTGPVAWVESSTLGLDGIFEEDRTRLMILCADESSAQTARVLGRLATDANRPVDRDRLDTMQPNDRWRLRTSSFLSVNSWSRPSLRIDLKPAEPSAICSAVSKLSPCYTSSSGNGMIRG